MLQPNNNTECHRKKYTTFNYYNWYFIIAVTKLTSHTFEYIFYQVFFTNDHIAVALHELCCLCEGWPNGVIQYFLACFVCNESKHIWYPYFQFLNVQHIFAVDSILQKSPFLKVIWCKVGRPWGTNLPADPTCRGKVSSKESHSVDFQCGGAPSCSNILFGWNVNNLLL